MMNYIKLVLIGGTLTLVLLGLGGLSVVVGIDATMHGRALTPGRSVSKVRIHRNYQSRQIPDRTYLWGPGLVAFGTSAFLAGVMVIPSAVMMEHGSPGSFPEVTGYRGGGPHGLGPAEWTEDTSMALALADSIAQVGWDLNDQASRNVAWWKKGEYSVKAQANDGRD